MQCHRSMFRRGLLIWSLTFVATHVSAALAQGEPPGPWTEERANALVRIEAPGKRTAPDVATGFIVNGHGGKQYVATVTHGLLPAATETQVETYDPDKCEPLPDDTKLFQGNTGGPELRPNCAYHIGNDVSLVQFFPGTRPLSALSFLACDLVASDDVYLGGFALGNDRIMMVGKVRGNGSEGMIIADSLTAGGLSGGPYLTADGDVVAVHRGQYSAGYAQILPVVSVRTKLEVLLPQIRTQDECPKPVMSEQAIQTRVAGLESRLAEAEQAIDGLNAVVERTIAGLRKEIQWAMTLNERPAAGNVVTIWYERLVSGDEQPPADSMVLTVRPVTYSLRPLNDPEEPVYSANHIPEVPGKSGKYEAFIDSALKHLASQNNMSVDTINIALKYRNGKQTLVSRSFTLSNPIAP